MSLKLVLTILVVLGLFASTGDAALVLHYDFESETGGVVDDISGFGTAIDLTLNNGASIVSDTTRGNVLSLDGDDDYGSTAANTAGNKLDTQASMTMMVWINTTTTTRDTIVSRSFGPGPFLEVNTTGHLEKATTHVGGPGVEAYSSTSVNDGSWHHVAMTHDGSTLSLFIDGGLESQTASGAPTDASQTLEFIVGDLGQSGGGNNGGRTFAGMIDDVRVYNSVLSEGEIQRVAGIPEPTSIAIAALALGGLLLCRTVQRQLAVR